MIDHLKNYLAKFRKGVMYGAHVMNVIMMMLKICQKTRNKLNGDKRKFYPTEVRAKKSTS